MTNTAGIPVMLQIEGWRVLIVGGGAVAARRAKTLSEAGAIVTVLAPEMDPKVETIDIQRIASRYDPAVHRVSDYRLVVIATDDADTNALVAVEVAKLPNPPLCNRADDGDAGDVSFMATHRDGPLTLAVHTGGASASAAAAIRDALVSQTDPAWPGVLTEARIARKQIQDEVADPAKRKAILGRLTDAAARDAFRAGGPEALRSHYRDIMRGSA